MIVVINNVSDNLPHRSACYRLSQFLLVGLVGLKTPMILVATMVVVITIVLAMVMILLILILLIRFPLIRFPLIQVQVQVL